MWLVNVPVLSLTWLLIVAVPVLLLCRNLPQIRISNGKLLKEYTASQARALPEKPAIILSDDLKRLELLQMFTVQSGQASNYLFLDSGSLRWPDYQRFLNLKYPTRWTNCPEQDQIQPFDDLEVRTAVTNAAGNNAIYYLHPSFGYYFEAYYPEPHGMVYKLDPYPTNLVFAPPLTQGLVEENEAFWSKADQDAIKPILTTTCPPQNVQHPGPLQAFMQFAHLPKEANPAALVLAGFYSRALDFWGVLLQRNGSPAPAAAHFYRAQELNPDNVAAQVNLEFNRNLQTGRRLPLQIPKHIEDQFGKYKNWEQILNENGPFDDPSFCYPQALVFARGKNYRQAAHEFERVKTLAPENLGARLWLTQLYILNRLPDLAISEVEQIHTNAELLGLCRTNQTELLTVETAAYLTRNDVSHADAAVRMALDKYPGDEELMAAASQVYLNYNRFSNALVTIDQQLKIDPDNISALVNKGFACLQNGQCVEAIPALTHALSLQTNSYLALFNRAIAYLQCGQLDDSQRDYEALQKVYPTFFKAYFGMGEIAYRKHETNSAIRCYQLYLTNAPPGTEEVKFVTARLAELRNPGSALRQTTPAPAPP